MYTPLCAPPPNSRLPWLRWNPRNVFHTSALCAALVDTATLPLRTRATISDAGLGAPTGEDDLISLIS